MSWHEAQYKKLAIQLFQTWWGDTNTSDLSFEITLSLYTEGRSSVDVLNLTFVEIHGQKATFIRHYTDLISVFNFILTMSHFNNGILKNSAPAFVY